jgi:hypothetical protein
MHRKIAYFVILASFSPMSDAPSNPPAAATAILPALRRIHGDAVPGLDLAAAIARLDRLAADPATALDPKLRHYLRQRSYGKALALVQP